MILSLHVAPQRVFLLGAGIVGLALIGVAILAFASPALPRVTISAESLAPRPIEQRTGEVVTHDYAQAWQDLAVCLDTNRTDLLDDYFTGEAKRRLAQRIAEQKTFRLRTHYRDRGHRVKAVFYSADGGELQLEDEAQLEVQVFDGGKLIATSTAKQKYLVLMTPGSDRWYVRFLQPLGDNAF